MISPEHYILRTKDVVCRCIDNEVFIIDDSGNKIHVLNKVGSFIWNQTETARTIRQIVDSVCARFDVSEAIALADTSELIEKMTAQGIVKLSDTPE
jgi:hypothetical protein